MANRDDISIALIGAGNMGGALLGGWLAEGFSAARITIIDPSPPERMRSIILSSGVRHLLSAPEDFYPHVMVLAVKPQIMGVVLDGVRSIVGGHTVCVSVAAGSTIEQIDRGLGDGHAIVRAMPNTPALVRRGMTVACANARTSEEQRDFVDGMLRAVGHVEWVADETLMDAVTAVSGSGPAYVFHLAECMAEAGTNAGLPEELALTLARHTIAGAGELMIKAQESPSVLRENVTSPNGTTAAALAVLMQDRAFAQLLNDAIAAAADRSRELSE